MGYSPWGHKESDMTEQACTFLVIFQGFSTLVQQQSLLGVGFFFFFKQTNKQTASRPNENLWGWRW